MLWTKHKSVVLLFFFPMLHGALQQHAMPRCLLETSKLATSLMCQPSCLIQAVVLATLCKDQMITGELPLSHSNILISNTINSHYNELVEAEKWLRYKRYFIASGYDVLSTLICPEIFEIRRDFE